MISSLPVSALRTHVESLGRLAERFNMRSQSLALVNLISKDTHLVFSISLFILLYRSVPATFVVKSDGSFCVSSALRTHVESLGKPGDVNMRSQSLAW